MTDPMQLHALADGELDPREANALRDALKADPRAAAEVDAILNFKDVLARQSVRHADDEAWKGCVRRLDAIDKSRRAENFVSRYAWAMCGFLFLFILSGRYAMRNVQGDTARTADLARVFGGSAAKPYDREQAAIYAQILNDATTGLDRTRVELRDPPVAAYYHGTPVVRYPLRDGLGDLDLTRVDGVLNLPDTAPLASNPELAASVAGGANCLVWHTPERTWFLSGGRSLDELAAFAGRLARAR